jgi:hypothetical protein
MKTIFSLCLICIFSSFAFAQQAQEKAKPVIVAGEGWGVVRLNAKRADVETALGKGANLYKSREVYFIDFADKGIQVSFNNSNDTVHAIFFYNGQRRSENFSVFDGAADKGINWSSSEEEVLKAYGKPKNDFGGPDWGGSWRRLVFEGIDFRFENKKMVRIGIPGN